MGIWHSTEQDSSTLPAYWRCTQMGKTSVVWSLISKRDMDEEDYELCVDGPTSEVRPKLRCG